jgi:hypothetical protein
MARSSPSITLDRPSAVALWSHALLGSSGPTPPTAPYRPLFSDSLCLLCPRDGRGSPLARLPPLCSFCHSHLPMRQLPCEAVGDPPTPTPSLPTHRVCIRLPSVLFCLVFASPLPLSVLFGSFVGFLALCVCVLDGYIVAVGGSLSLQSIVRVP